MLRYGKDELQSKGSEKFNRERMIEKALSKFNRKLEMMVDSKLPASHILNSASAYGLEAQDYSEKVKNYLAAQSSSETESKVQKTAQKKSESKKAKEIKAESSQEPSADSE